MSDDIKKLVIQYVDKVVVGLAALILLLSILFGFVFSKGDLKKTAEELESKSETIRTNLMTSQPPRIEASEEMKVATDIEKSFKADFKVAALREGVFHPPLPGLKRVWVRVEKEREIDFDGRTILTDLSNFDSDKVSIVVLAGRKALKITGRNRGEVDVEIKTKREETGEEKSFLVRIKVTEKPPPKALYPPINLVAVAKRAPFSAELYWDVDRRQMQSFVKTPEFFIIERKTASKSPKFEVIAKVKADKAAIKKGTQTGGSRNTNQPMEGQMQGPGGMGGQGAAMGGMGMGGMDMGGQGAGMGGMAMEGMNMGGMDMGGQGAGMGGMTMGGMDMGGMEQGPGMGTGTTTRRREATPKGSYKYTDEKVKPGETYVYRVSAFAKNASPKQSLPSDEAINFYSSARKREIVIPTDIEWYVGSGTKDMARITIKKWYSDDELDLETWIRQTFNVYRGQKMNFTKKGVLLKYDDGSYVKDENDRPIRVRETLEFFTDCTLVDIVNDAKRHEEERPHVKVVYENKDGVLGEKWDDQKDPDEEARKKEKKARRKTKRGGGMDTMEGGMEGDMMGQGAMGGGGRGRRRR